MIIKNIPFVVISRAELDFLAKAESKVEKYSCRDNFRAFPTVYVSLSDLKEKAREAKREKAQKDTWFAPSIWQGEPGFMCPSWERQIKKGYYGRFSTGRYKSTTQLLLVDDVIEWSHHRRESKDIRTAWDIIWELKNDNI